MEQQAKKTSGRKLVRWIPYAGIAAAIIVVVLAVGNRDRELIDTFDDPALAYAQVEDAFNQISSKMARGIEIASESDTTANNIESETE